MINVNRETNKILSWIDSNGQRRLKVAILESESPHEAFKSYLVTRAFKPRKGSLSETEIKRISASVNWLTIRWFLDGELGD